jgi:hypothetical protein
MTYQEALSAINEAIAEELDRAGVIVVNVDPARAVAEAIGLREIMEALAPFADYARDPYIQDPTVPDHGMPANTPHTVGEYRKAARALSLAP